MLLWGSTPVLAGGTPEQVYPLGRSCQGGTQNRCTLEQNYGIPTGRTIICCIVFRKVKDQEELWNYSLERLQGYVTEDLLKDLKVDLEERKK